MPFSPTDIQLFAKLLDDAMLEAREIDRLTSIASDMTIAEGYAIQDAGILLRLERREKVIGMKMGLTSQAKMKQMGVDSPIYGTLTNVMKIADESEFSLDGRIHPKIEPEIAFITARELSGSPSREDVIAACSGVCAAMEIIDSRYLNFNFNLPDVVADNCSSSAFVLGRELKRPSEVDLGNLGMLMEINGKSVQFGASSAIYGHPADSVAELCRMLAKIGKSLPAGSIVLAGGATAAVPMELGAEIRTSVQDLGSVTVHVGTDYGK